MPYVICLTTLNYVVVLDFGISIFNGPLNCIRAKVGLMNIRCPSIVYTYVVLDI